MKKFSEIIVSRLMLAIVICCSATLAYADVITNEIHFARTGGTKSTSVIQPAGPVWWFRYNDRPKWILDLKVEGFSIQQNTSSSLNGSAPRNITIQVAVTSNDGAERAWEYVVTCDDMPVWVVRCFQESDAPKVLSMIPVGPSCGSSLLANRYGCAAGLGQGCITVNDDSSTKWFCSTVTNLYGTSKSIFAHGYRVGDVDERIDIDGNSSSSPQRFTYSDAYFDSYLYGLIVTTPETEGVSFTQMAERGEGTESAIDVPLTTEKNSDGEYLGTIVEAIFSKEYLASDNMGDINRDGVPDVYREAFPELYGENEDDLQSLNAINDDEDYLPGTSFPYSAFIPGVSTSLYSAFTAKLEIRGYGESLNDAPSMAGIKNVVPEQRYTDPDVDEKSTLSKLEYLAWSDYTNEHTSATIEDWSPERPSNPTVDDTDGDGICDGVEYWWWYRAHVGYFDADDIHCYVTGRRYSVPSWPSGETITRTEIEAVMDPIVAHDSTSEDTDGDGLCDLLETELGTNPFDYDTDGDCIPDGYEIIITGTDPLRASTTGIGLDKDCITVAEEVVCYYDGQQHSIPFENTNAAIRVLWSDSLCGDFSTTVPSYSSLGVYTNWCYTAYTSGGGEENYGGVQMSVLKILPIEDGHHAVDLNGVQWYVTISGGTAVVDGCEDTGSTVLDIPSTIGGCPVVGIGSHAFYFSKYTQVSLPSTLHEIGEWAFAGSAITSLEIPEGITTLGAGAFSSCQKLSSLSLPTTLESIGMSAFVSCDNLPSVFIPANVKNIGTEAFGGNQNMLSIAVDDGNPTYASVNGLLYDKTQKVLLAVPGGLTGILLPETTEEIGQGAFYFCGKITYIKLPDAVGIIGDSAFAGCSKLRTIQLPDNLRTIGNAAFQLCTSLNEVTIPSSVTSIGTTVFGGCRSLSVINVEEGNAAYKSIDGILCDASGTRLLSWPEGRSDIVFPSSIRVIAACAFYDFERLVELTIPSQIQTIERNAFDSCRSLVRVFISDGVVTIAEGAFSGCTDLKEISLPKTLDYLGRQAFFLCQSLQSVKFRGNCPTYVGNSIYLDTPAELTTYVPSTSTGWGVEEFPSVWCYRPIVSYPGDGYYSALIDGCTWYFTITDGSVEIGRKDKMGNPVDAPAVDPLPSGDFVVPECLWEFPVVSIGAHAFTRCHDLVSAQLPDAITNIGVSAFFDCEMLECINLPNELKLIGRYAFAGCSAIQDANIPEFVESIDTAAYADCQNLNYVWLGMSVTNVGAAAFANCSALNVIDVDGANEILASYDGMLFNKQLTRMIACPGMKSEVILPDCLHEIADAAFLDCKQIAALTIPPGVSLVGSQSFSRCENLQSVTFEGDCPECVSSNIFLDSPLDLKVIAYTDAKGWPTTGLWCERTLEMRRRDGMCEVIFDPCGGTVAESSRLVKCGSVIGALPVPACSECIFEGWRDNAGEVVSEDRKVVKDETLTASWLHEEITQNGTLRYRIVSNGAHLVQAINANGDWFLPPTVAGVSVVNIEEACFAFNTNLYAITLPSSITNIGAYAFYGCPNLQRMNHSEGLLSIRSGAFANCGKLTDIELPKSLQTLGDIVALRSRRVFQHEDHSSEYATNYVVVASDENEESTITVDERKAFYTSWRGFYGKGVYEDCVSLTNVIMCDGVSSIGAGAFCNCKMLKSVLIPETVVSIGGYAELESQNDSYDSAYRHTTDLLDQQGQISNLDSETANANTNHGSQITVEPHGFCEGCASLEFVVLPPDLRLLGAHAFCGCENLKSISLPDSLTTIMEGTFSGCKRLAQIKFPRNLELIGGIEWFPTIYSSRVVSYNRVVQNGSASTLSNYSAYSQWYERGKRMMESVWSNNGQDYSSWSNAVDLIELDNRWKPDCNTWICPVDTNCDAWIEQTGLVDCLERLGVNLPEEDWSHMRQTRSRLHPSCSDYAQMNDGTTRRQWAGAFGGCYSLRNVELPNSVKRIAPFSFYDCVNLQSVIVPDGLQILGRDAFGGETAPRCITTPWLNFGGLQGIFHNHAFVTNLVFTSGPKQLKDFYFIQREIEARSNSEAYFSECEKEEVAHDLIYGSWIYDYEILAGFRRLKSLTLPEGMEMFDRAIGWYDAECLQNIILPQSLKTLGVYAFEECRIADVSIPGSVEKICDYAFAYSGLERIMFEGNAPWDVSTDLFVSEDDWWYEGVAREDLTILVYPGTTGWDGWHKTGTLPEDFLWPTDAVEFKRRSIEYVGQQLSASVGGVGTDDAFVFYDTDKQKLVSVPQSWLSEYGLLNTAASGDVSVSTLSPIANRSLYQSYVAGLDPTDETDEFHAKIDIVDGEVKVSWSPELPPEKAALRKYTTYGCKEIGGEWVDMDAVSETFKSDYHFFKVTVDMQ